MGRTKKTDRQGDYSEFEDDAPDEREGARDDQPKFENAMFADAAESPLYIPPEEWPEGMALRWIRIEAGNAPDKTNWAKMSRIGWIPVARSVFKDRFPSMPMPGGDQTGADEHIIFGGLCLCQRPMKLLKRDKAMQEQATAEAGRTIETYVEGGNSQFPRFNQSQPVEFQRARAQFKE